MNDRDDMIFISIDRSMVVQAVLDGQIGSEHVTVDELVTAHYLLADAAIAQSLHAALQRDDVLVVNLAWQYDVPN
jgi:hypothetical protein